jgi:hypothetical protein
MAEAVPDADGAAAASGVELLELDPLVKYLSALAPVLLDGDANAFRASVRRHEALLKQFISDGQSPLLLVRHSKRSSAEETADDEGPSPFHR